MNSSLKGYLYAMISGSCFGLIPIVILQLGRVASVPSSMCIFFRMLITAIYIWPVALRRIKDHPVSGQMLRTIFIGSVFASATSILLYASYDFIPSGIGVALHYTYPLVVMLMSAVLFRMRFNKATVCALFMSFAGVVLLCDTSILPEGALPGLLLAIGSAVTFGSYLLWTDHHEVSKAEPMVYMAIFATLDAVLIGLYNVAIGNFRLSFGPGAYAILFVMGSLGMIAYLSQLLAINEVGAVFTSILGTLEPIICTIGSALVLHDRLSARTVIGSAIVITAVIIVTYANREKEDGTESEAGGTDGEPVSDGKLRVSAGEGRTC